MSSRRWPARQARLIPAFALVVTLAGCGGDEESSVAGIPAEAPPVVNAPAAAPAAGPVEPPPEAPDVAAVVEVERPLETVPDVAVAPDPPPVELTMPTLATEDPDLTLELAAMIDAADTIAGRAYAQRCASCHEVDPATQGAAAAQIGPPLGDIIGRAIGSVTSFDYSPVFRLMAETGAVWTPARLDLFLTDPAESVPGTAMSSGVVADQQDRANLIAFLIELSGAERGSPGDPDLIARIAAADADAGRTLAARCSGCHRFAADETPLIGPHLSDIVGAPVGAVAGFAYSPALQALNGEGAVWTFGFLDEFLENPSTAIPGTRMGFAGIADAADRAAIIAFLRSLSPDPVPIVAPTDVVGNERAGLRPVAFDASQVERGRADYAELGCVGCHSADLRGGIDMRVEGFGVAPPLVGPNFTLRWYGGSVSDLFDYLQSRKPRDAPGAYTAEVYAGLIAFILSRNGFLPAEVALPADRPELERTGFYQ